MFAFFRFVLFVAIAAATGIVAVSVPIRGRTIAEHVQEYLDGEKAKDFISKGTGVGAAVSPERRGGVDSEEGIDDEDRAELELILERSR